jgi:3-phenylpropionate/trans-cinnamate dioxygenase ferredoxin subunit
MSEWIDVCAVDDVELEDVIGIEYEGTSIAIYRSPEGEFFATAGMCTHKNQLLCDGLVMGSVIECPKHNGRFDYRTGAALGAPVIEALATFPTRVQDGRVLIQWSPEADTPGA